MIDEAPLVQTEHGLVPEREGWFVLNARDAPWHDSPGRAAAVEFEGPEPFAQIGINVAVLAPGETIGVYHYENDQEDFLILRGEALLLIEGEERPLKAWDFVHCPVGAEHMIVGAGTEPCVLVAVGGRAHQAGDDWGVYTVDPLAQRHGVGVSETTHDPDVAYADFAPRQVVAYRDDWLGA
jgi:uncharacterized cupin superfamily protein